MRNFNVGCDEKLKQAVRHGYTKDKLLYSKSLFVRQHTTLAAD
jgi:hypothetical protein